MAILHTPTHRDVITQLTVDILVERVIQWKKMSFYNAKSKEQYCVHMENIENTYLQI